MAITVRTLPPHGLVGPGFVLMWQSNFVGPIETGSVWRIQIFGDAATVQEILLEEIPATTQSGSLQVLTTNQDTHAINLWGLRDNDQCWVYIQLLDPRLQPLDSVLQIAVWSLAGAPFADYIRWLVSGGSGGPGGFTAADRLLLAQTHDLIYPGTPLVAGSVHAGLTLEGVIDLVAPSSAIEVVVAPTPPSWPQNPGEPAYFFNMGFITSWSGPSPLKGWRLVYLRQVFPLAAQSTSVSYTLPVGITIQITELRPAN